MGLKTYYKLTFSSASSCALIPSLRTFAIKMRKKFVSEVFKPQLTPNGYCESHGLELILKRKVIHSNAGQG